MDEIDDDKKVTVEWRLFGESGKLVILVNLRIEGEY